MKLIKAYVRTYMADKVISALKEINTPRISATDVRALGDEIHEGQLDVSPELGSTYTTMVKIEIISPDKCVEEIKETILKNARTGYRGDGIMAVSPVDEAINIRTGNHKKP